MIFLIAILSSFLTFAQDCSEVNLITQQNTPFSRMPVLDQAGSGMCYAYAAAQLANYQLIKSGQAERPVVHPAWAGMLYKERAGERDLRGGITSISLDAIAAAGNCDEQSVCQAIKARAQLVGVPEARIMKFLDDYGLMVSTHRFNTEVASDRARALDLAAARNAYCPQSNWRRLIGMPEMIEKDSVAAMRVLLADSCQEQNRTHLNLPPYQRLRQGDDHTFGSRIDSVLDRGNPVGMTFCSWATDKPQPTPPHYVSMVQNGYRQVTVSERECGTHIALIAGRKKIGGSCHYLYRNSRGTGWYRDIRHLTCLCKIKRTNEFVENCRYQTHNNSKYIVEACWVPKANVVPNILDLIHY
jgi:hypothetical protein